MTLKDWKKIRSVSKHPSVVHATGYENNEGHKIFLVTLNKNRQNRYHFRPGLVSQTKEFKTKKQLLRHAKSYMRKH